MKLLFLLLGYVIIIIEILQYTQISNYWKYRIQKINN